MIALPAEFCLFAAEGWFFDVTGQDNFEIKSFALKTCGLTQQTDAD